MMKKNIVKLNSLNKLMSLELMHQIRNSFKYLFLILSIIVYYGCENKNVIDNKHDKFDRISPDSLIYKLNCEVDADSISLTLNFRNISKNDTYFIPVSYWNFDVLKKSGESPESGMPTNKFLMNYFLILPSNSTFQTRIHKVGPNLDLIPKFLIIPNNEEICLKIKVKLPIILDKKLDYHLISFIPFTNNSNLNKFKEILNIDTESLLLKRNNYYNINFDSTWKESNSNYYVYNLSTISLKSLSQDNITSKNSKYTDGITKNIIENLNEKNIPTTNQLESYLKSDLNISINNVYNDYILNYYRSKFVDLFSNRLENKCFIKSQYSKKVN